jgi:drug/metabolite transporter (DMT)-like permease
VPSSRRRWNLRVLAAAGAYASTMILFVTSNKLTTAAHSIFLQSTAPIYLLVLSPRLLAEPVARRDVAMLGPLVVGLALLVADSDIRFATAPDPALGDALAVASGVAWAFTVTALRWLERRDPALGSGATLVAGNVIAFAACVPFALPVPGRPPSDWIPIVYLGVFQIGCAYLCLTRGIRGVPAFEASLLLLVEPVLNPVWVWLVHGEAIGPRTALGAAIIVAATAVRAWLESRGRARLAGPELPGTPPGAPQV